MPVSKPTPISRNGKSTPSGKTRAKGDSASASRRASSEGAEWARAQKRNVRTCCSCAYGKVNPRFLAFVRDAWLERLAGRSQVSRDALVREVKVRFPEYPYGEGLRNHLENCVKP